VIKYNFAQDTPQAAPFRLTRIDGGLNVRDEQSQLRDNQSPSMQNVNCDDRGALQKRPGWEKVYATSLGAGAVHLVYDYRKTDGTVVTLIHHGTKLYTQADDDQPVEIHSGISNAKGAAFVFGGIFYYVDGTNFIQYNGTAVAAVTGYVPTVTLARGYDGGGTAFENYNHLSNSWKDSFSPDGTHGTFLLSQTGLSATLVKVWLAGVEKTELTHFTVNRTTGVVDCAAGTSPMGVPAAGTNTLVIQAEKADLMDPTAIKGCKYAAIYGGENDTRVFLTGNPSNPATVYNSGLTDPTYWPENGDNKVGSDADHNTGLIVHYDSLILLKERSIWRMQYAVDDTGVAYFPTYPVNSAIGCDMPGSLQLIDNYPVFCNTYGGVHILLATQVREEKNVKPISGLVNGAPSRPGILDEAKADLLAATSVDWDGKYHLCVGSKVWVWDYQLSPYSSSTETLAWFPYTNINANCFLVRDLDCYFGDRTAGLAKKFTPETFNDGGVAIDAWWKSKLQHFGLPEWYKTINELFFRSRETANTKLTIRYFTDADVDLDPVEVKASSFNLAKLSLDIFTMAIWNFPPVFRLRPKLKKTVYFQFEVSNNTLNQNLSFMDMVVNFVATKRVK
jgi:hypothetical protein